MPEEDFRHQHVRERILLQMLDILIALQKQAKFDDNNGKTITS